MVNNSHQQQIQMYHQDNEKKPYNGEVLDLSRRRDSVETRKTPSPYNSSSFEEGSPSTMHDSPSASSTTQIHENVPRSATPLRRYTSPTTTHHYRQQTTSPNTNSSTNNYVMQYQCEPKRETPSPPIESKFTRTPKIRQQTSNDDVNPYMLHTIQRHIDENKRETISPIHANIYSQSSRSMLPTVLPTTIPNCDSVVSHHPSAYMIQAAALQQHISAQAQLNQQPQHHHHHQHHHNLHSSPHNESDESSENGSFTGNTSASYSPTTSRYPMVLGRDGKLTRPFKAYPRDPLSITASFTASDTLMDTQSAEKYQIFRKEMLKQIRAANGGQPTLSNPKMRRTSIKSIDHSNNNNAGGDSIKQQQHNNIDMDMNQLNNHHRLHNDTNNNGNSNLSDSSSIGSGHGIDGNSNGLTGGSGSGSGAKDNAYYERRKKNNAAAKKSRDRRRIKEDEIAIRANFLERENIELKFELAAARKQLALYGVKT